MKTIKEHDKMHGRYHFIVAFMPRGYRNGYIGIPTEEFYDMVRENSNFMEEIDVHGGITYEGGDLSILGKKGFSYIGFDCNHFGDKVDVQSMIQYNMDLDVLKSIDDGFYEEKMNGIIKTKAFVLEELDNMLQQIKDPDGIIASYCSNNNYNHLYTSVLTRELDEDNIPEDLLLFMELNNIKY